METKKFQPIMNQGQEASCPPMPPPCPPPEACPYPHGHMFQGCIAYINSYIDIRAKQLYAKIKDYVKKIVGKYNGPWDNIILRDVSHPENEYKVFVRDENLYTDKYNAAADDVDTGDFEGRLAKVSADVVRMRQDTTQMEGSTQQIDAQISTLETDVSALGTRIRAVGSSISSLESSMRAVGASVSAMGASVTSLESRVAVLERDGGGDDNVYVPATTFNSQMDAIRGSISGLNSRTTSLESQVQTLQQDVESLKANPGDPSSGGTTDPEMEGRVDAVEADVEQLTSNISTLTASVSTLKSDVSSLKTFKNTVEGYGIPTIKSDISNLKNRVQALESSSGQGGGGAFDTSYIDDELESLSDRIAVLEQRTSILGDLANYNIMVLTREQYNQIQEKDSQTLYFIVGE